MSEDEWAEVARAALQAQEANRIVGEQKCLVPGCSSRVNLTDNGVVKLHYPTPAAVHPCVSSWKILCKSCGMPMLNGEHLITRLKTC